VRGAAMLETGMLAAGSQCGVRGETAVAAPSCAGDTNPDIEPDHLEIRGPESGHSTGGKPF